jgi:hypothetical protein
VLSNGSSPNFGCRIGDPSLGAYPRLTFEPSEQSSLLLAPTMKRASSILEKEQDILADEFRERRVREEEDAAAIRSEKAAAAVRRRAASLDDLVEKLDASGYSSLAHAEITLPSSIPNGPPRAPLLTPSTGPSFLPPHHFSRPLPLLRSTDSALRIRPSRDSCSNL